MVIFSANSWANSRVVSSEIVFVSDEIVMLYNLMDRLLFYFRMSERENSSPDNDDFDLGGAIFELESAIAQLKQRYNQVEKDQIRQKVLEEEKKRTGETT